ncbi:hypothetical protein HKK52_20990 [Pseudomonas sp. ADAK2]|uniref:dermonecrotic toxin domain-containing protein n=1 Tax=unclassified Pseudomonas TaxID=196821 RepID=UPI00146313AB|nr:MULTISPECIES: DUF6543 domain-containing protein [unclassified Pseudomonas]QJI43322.1 hypothetical protein HKK53_20995 [Pseudomonas sp. ADAK7]QJI49625.1 hypothetical protein HKK52_20990 [Pseudomonas sp. ADAK2]
MMIDPTPALQNTGHLLQEKSSLIIQTSLGPSLSEVAAKVLREALKQQYPELNIDPDETLIVTPQWKWQGESLVSAHPHVEILTQALVRQGQFGSVANFIEAEHFLTSAPLSQSPLHLAVSVEDIAATLNNFAPLLFIEFQQQQLDFWNETVEGKPRWHELSDTLKKALDIRQVKGWDTDQCAVARAVSQHPDKTERAKNNLEIPGIQACLIDIDYNETSNTRHLLLGGAIVMKATYKQRDILLLYTIEDGYEAFDSMDRLGASLPRRIDMEPTGQSLQWRLYEPDGNIFDHMAGALIGGQMEAIAAIRPLSPLPPLPFVPAPSGSGAGHFSAEEQRHVDDLETAIPEWLANASATDLLDYGSYLSSQGRLRNASGLNDIPLIGQYAQDKMIEAIIADKNLQGATLLPLPELRITITNSFTVGAFTLPNPHDQHRETLGEFALQNTPPYKAELNFTNRERCPDWLTVEYLTRMAEQVNVGKTYPELLRKKLIDNADQARLQKKRYVELLPDLLRLKALECKLRHEGGVDDTGYRYVCELMRVALGKRRKHSLTIVIRPLTFVPRHRLLSGGDTVANMFIIGPRQQRQGPCLLYRPALEQPLLQFASVQNMMYAMHQPGELRDSVLAWLPTPTLSFEYSQYVFPVGLPSPWLAVESGIELLLNHDLSGPIGLGQQEITDDLLATLFTSNANTLVQKAERQSLSNGERRWALLRDSGWAIFNAASTFLSGPVGTAAWVWQSIADLQQGLDAHERGDSLVQWTSLGDVLMTLGMVLIHRAGQRRKTAETESLPGTRDTAHASDVPPRPVPVPTTISLSAEPVFGELPAEHATALETAESLPRRTPSSLGMYLDSVKVSAPDLTSKNLNTLNVTPPHLYQLDDKQYAQVGNRWFEVLIDEDEHVQIFNPDSPSRSGPLLTSDTRGHWIVDLRLRLRGGGPKRRLKALQQQKEVRRDALQQLIQAFKLQENIIKEEVTRLHNELVQSTGDRFEQHCKVFTDKLEALIKNHLEVIEHLNEWRTLGGTLGYTYDLLRLTTLLEKYLSYWLTVKTNQYTQAIAPFAGEGSINTATAVGENVASLQTASDLSDTIVERMDQAQTSLERLNVLGRAGRIETRRLAKLLPRLTVQDFKANQIGMSYELCVQEQASAQMPQARAAVAGIVIDAADASHKLTDLMKQLQVTETTDQRIATYSDLTDTYADTLQRIEDLPARYPGMTHPQALERLATLIKEFQALARERLDALLPEREENLSQQTPEPAIAGPSRPQIKVTKTRPREPAADSEQKTEEQAFKKLQPVSEGAGKAAMDDIDVIDEGLTLSIDVNDFITRTRKDAQRPSRIPADMQHLFDQQAQKLENAAASVDKAMNNIRAAQGSPPPVARLSQELREAVILLRVTGVSVRAAMLKKRKPRQEYFQWLYKQDQLKVVRNDLGRLKTRQRADYFQEYRILDATDNDQDLWVAHFHYPAPDSPADQPTAAHLKVADKYLDRLEPDLRQTLAAIEPIDYVFRRISDPATRDVFLALEPTLP